LNGVIGSIGGLTVFFGHPYMVKAPINRFSIETESLYIYPTGVRYSRTDFITKV